MVKQAIVNLNGEKIKDRKLSENLLSLIKMFYMMQLF